MKGPRVRGLVYLCFFLSGAAGLMYEVIWARQLSLFLGITGYAHTAVITAYMVGLAIGSLLFGRRADTLARPLWLYARLEAAIGLYAAATPWLFGGLVWLFSAGSRFLPVEGTGAYLLRFVTALLALLVPTVLMGGTLPLVARWLSSGVSELAPTVGTLYGINTLGATVGTLAAGYLFLPNLGVRGSLMVAVGLNLGVAAVAAWLAAAAGGESQESAAAQPGPAAVEPQAGAPRLGLLVGFALSGFAALLYQIAWIRSLTLVIGASVYAFSLTLATFLGGLALGSLVYSRLRIGCRRRLALAGWLELAIAAGALLGLFATGRLPGLFLRGYSAGAGESFLLMQLFVGGLCALLMIGPTFLLGALFPLMTGLLARRDEERGRTVGIAYAANTAGTILGALVGGLVLLPWLGIQRSIVLGSAVHVTVGTAFLLLETGDRTRKLLAAVLGVGVFVSLLWALPGWDRTLMTSGVFSRPDALGGPEGLPEAIAEEKLLYYEEGIEGTVAVLENPYQRRLVINGKTDATSRGDLPTQVMLGQLPLLLRPDSRDVLVIGLGSGITSHSILTHSSVESLDVVELSPEVVEASNLFARENHGVLGDSRLRLILADARSLLHARAKRYDVIVSEPSNPWISGVSNLFTREAFELARSRLQPGGLMVQWFHTYAMGVAELKSVLRTFQAVFPHVSVWMPLDGDLILAGSDTPHSFAFGTLEKALEGGPVREDLTRIEKDSPDKLARLFLIGGSDLRSYAAGADLNTDDHPRIEFNAPRYLYARTTALILADIIEHLESGYRRVPLSLAPPAAVTDELVEVPSLNLRVRAPGVSSKDWKLEWLVSRSSFKDVDSLLQVGVTSQRLLEWRSGAVTTRAQAVSLSGMPSLESTDTYLRSLLSAPATVGGTFTLTGGSEGFWLSAPGVRAGSVEIALTWLCTRDDALTRYGVARQQPEVGPGRIGTALTELAGAFECL